MFCTSEKGGIAISAAGLGSTPILRPCPTGELIPAIPSIFMLDHGATSNVPGLVIVGVCTLEPLEPVPDMGIALAGPERERACDWDRERRRVSAAEKRLFVFVGRESCCFVEAGARCDEFLAIAGSRSVSANGTVVWPVRKSTFLVAVVETSDASRLEGRSTVSGALSPLLGRSVVVVACYLHILISLLDFYVKNAS